MSSSFCSKIVMLDILHLKSVRHIIFSYFDMYLKVLQIQPVVTANSIASSNSKYG